MPDCRTQTAFETDRNDQPAMLSAYLVDIIECTGGEQTLELLEAYREAVSCYWDDPEAGLGIFLGFGLALANTKKQRDAVGYAFLWLGM